jgi:hypothetical protein
LSCAAVNCEDCRLAITLQVLAVTICNSSTYQISNPRPCLITQCMIIRVLLKDCGLQTGESPLNCTGQQQHGCSEVKLHKTTATRLFRSLHTRLSELNLFCCYVPCQEKRRGFFKLSFFGKSSELNQTFAAISELYPPPRVPQLQLHLQLQLQLQKLQIVQSRRVTAIKHVPNL